LWQARANGATSNNRIPKIHDGVGTTIYYHTTMKVKLLSAIFYICATCICLAQETTSLIKWTFDRPFSEAYSSESSFSANKGISAVGSGTWSSSVLSVGGVDETGGFLRVSGWDFGDTPTAYYLFSGITLPDEYDEIEIKLYLFSNSYAPKAYDLEASVDNEVSWNLIDVFTLNTEAETWTPFVATTTALKDAATVSFRIRANSNKSLGNGTISFLGSSGVDNFEVAGKKSAGNDLKEITGNGEKIYANGNGQLVIESVLPLQSIKIYNTAGQIIRQLSNTSFETIRLNQGTYIIETQTGGFKSVKKVIVM
jgi:hypothetical protein